jgi:hypothetical protein
MRDDLLLKLYGLKNDDGPRGRALDVQVEAIDKATEAMREALRALR